MFRLYFGLIYQNRGYWVFSLVYISDRVRFDWNFFGQMLFRSLGRLRFDFQQQDLFWFRSIVWLFQLVFSLKFLGLFLWEKFIWKCDFWGQDVGQGSEVRRTESLVKDRWFYCYLCKNWLFISLGFLEKSCEVYFKSTVRGRMGKFYLIFFYFGREGFYFLYLGFRRQGC